MEENICKYWHTDKISETTEIELRLVIETGLVLTKENVNKMIEILEK